MKKTLSLILALIMLFGLSAPVFAELSHATYYVNSESGDDSASGLSEAEAWKTTARLQHMDLGPGDRILFARGLAYETDALTFNFCCGSMEAPIILSSYGDESLPKPLLFTEKRTEVLILNDCSYFTISDLEITAHNGGGIWIDTWGRESRGITLTGLTMHDMQNYELGCRDELSLGAAEARACVMVKGYFPRSVYGVHDLTITDCEMYDVGNGISLWGAMGQTYNENALIENVYFHDMAAEAIIVGVCRNALVTHCRAINCCQDECRDESGAAKGYNAAMWFWGSEYCTIEHCEIAGQKNYGDGMTVDFDSGSNYCTYRYIYSHDNRTFMKNCATDTAQRGNTVHHCLSVNDNGGRLSFAAPAGEDGFSFYNNTIVNCGEISFENLTNSLVCNNIIIPKLGYLLNIDPTEMLSDNGNTICNNCYYNCVNALDLGSFNLSPAFASDDYSNPQSFKLSASSLLIGRGYENTPAEQYDFFGNPVLSNNIGCYGGTGEATRISLCSRLLRTLSDMRDITHRIVIGRL